MIERDGLQCWAGNCQNEARVATPSGPLCRPCANELARDERRVR